MKKRILFLDRDGVLLVEPADEQIDSLEKLEFYPGVFGALNRIAQSGIYEFVIVTNQDGLGTASFPESDFLPAHQKMLQAFENEGILFSDIFIDRTFEHEHKSTRKPGTDMLKKYFSPAYDLSQSFVVGDRQTDMLLAKNLGAYGILLLSKKPKFSPINLNNDKVFVATSWSAIATHVISPKRKVSHIRKTKETTISISIDLHGSGLSNSKTGLGLLDHLIDQLAKHSQMNIDLQAKGDLHVDEHHTIEDCAITLGEALAEALGDKRGIERYGFCLPMDDALAQVAIDFGGRPWLVWDVEFKREKIGDVPTEMFFHFFKSFTDASRCNLNVKAEGQNEHHKIEAIFKAFAKAIKMATRSNGTDELPSTKGKL